MNATIERHVQGILEETKKHVLEDVTKALGLGNSVLKRGEASMRIGLGKGLELRAPRVKLSSTTASAADVLAYVRENPNSRADQIRVGLGVNPKAALVELMTGQRRGARYAAK